MLNVPLGKVDFHYYLQPDISKMFQVDSLSHCALINLQPEMQTKN